MKRLQNSSAAKFTAVLLLLALTFLGTLFGLQALLALPYQGTENYEQTNEYDRLFWQKADQVSGVYAEKLYLDTTQLSYAERKQLEADLTRLLNGLKPENTNFRYRIYDQNGVEIDSNLQADEKIGEVHYATFEAGSHSMTPTEGAGSFTESAPDQFNTGSADFEILIDTSDLYTAACATVSQDDLYKTGVKDEFFHLLDHYYVGTHNFSTWVALSVGLLAGALLSLLYILWTAGHKAGEEKIVLTWQDRIFSEVYLAAMAGAGFGLLCGVVYLTEYLLSDVYHYGPGAWQADYQWLIPAVSALAALLVGVIALTLRTLAVRLKAHAMARTTLVCRVAGRCWRFCRDLVRGIPLFWKTAVGYAVFFFANVALFTEGQNDGFWALLWFLLNGAVFLGLCWWALSFRRLREGSRAIAAGDLHHRLDTARMPMDLKNHAEDLNNISSGLAAAVDEQMKSERFKAELITNVSHDLKTPLTSIISYVDLLKTTDQTDPKAVEYIEVLDRKSQRLKKLTEDLVEASKASTGVLTVNREKIGMAQLMDQALGEWTEKLQARNLTLVTAVPEGETWVYADGRHLWRVIDNLLSNCAKYAMEGTRVYLDLTRGKGQVSLSVKNISREPLNVPPDRLMERFVRGEESRSTEGSGLGLSIARSLTELQGGTFDLAVDGDLFKATLSLPQAN